MAEEIDLQNNENLADGGDFKLPSLEQVMQILEGMDISDEERERIRVNILEQQAQAGEILRQQMQSNTGSGADYLAFVAMLTLIALVFVLFGYKLYKSLIEKDRKREEKIKAKQSKKKK